jgi:hypothetical protein
MKDYGWREWISNPLNRKKYDESPQQALREYNSELQRRANLADYYESLKNKR